MANLAEKRYEVQGSVFNTLEEAKSELKNRLAEAEELYLTMVSLKSCTTMAPTGDHNSTGYFYVMDSNYLEPSEIKNITDGTFSFHNKMTGEHSFIIASELQGKLMLAKQDYLEFVRLTFVAEVTEIKDNSTPQRVIDCQVVQHTL